MGLNSATIDPTEINIMSNKRARISVTLNVPFRALRLRLRSRLYAIFICMHNFISVCRSRACVVAKKNSVQEWMRICCTKFYIDKRTRGMSPKYCKSGATLLSVNRPCPSTARCGQRVLGLLGGDCCCCDPHGKRTLGPAPFFRSRHLPCNCGAELVFAYITYRTLFWTFDSFAYYTSFTDAVADNTCTSTHKHEPRQLSKW